MPPGGVGTANDETGIVAATRDRDSEYYVLSYRTGHHGASAWGGEACILAVTLAVDAFVVETNFGGDMARQVIRESRATASSGTASFGRPRAASRSSRRRRRGGSAACLTAPPGEVVSGGERVRAVRTQHPHQIGQQFRGGGGGASRITRLPPRHQARSWRALSVVLTAGPGGAAQ